MFFGEKVQKVLSFEKAEFLDRLKLLMLINKTRLIVFLADNFIHFHRVFYSVLFHNELLDHVSVIETVFTFVIYITKVKV